LNLGCPAKIIVSKGKGAGMLADTYDLNVFFDEIFNYDWKARITVKSRLGLTENADFTEIMEVFSRYPIYELAIHPRFRTDFYNGKPRLEEFDKVFSVLEKTPNNTMKVCYNGNVNTIKDIEYIIKRYPIINSIMLGRGALANPAIIRILKGGKEISMAEFKGFHDDILNSYSEVGFKDKILMYKMKEMWNYWSDLVDCNIDVLRRLRLSENVEQYDIVMNEIYENWKLKDNNGIV
jgi:tRNA-dihydrouridine synthase